MAKTGIPGAKKPKLPYYGRVLGTHRPHRSCPTSVANLKHNKKAYAHIWFLVEPNCWDAIIELKSGHKAQAALKAKHEKDTLSTCMNLCQRFYALSHNHALV